MNGTRQSHGPVPSEGVRAKAAAWVAQLHDEQRGADLDARVHAWLAESEDHRYAFDRMTRVWEQTKSIRMRARGDVAAARTGRLRYFPWAATAAAVLVLAVVVAAHYRRGDALVTAIGQRQVQSLPDGTRVVLNTDTRIEVHYDKSARRVKLIHGEAWFEVSHRPAWPFLVNVDGEEIRALGTSFIVRHDDIQDLAVTLIEGRVSVAPIHPNDRVPFQDPQILVSGQRFVISRHHSAAVDRPEMSRVTAWKRGQVEFEQTPLGDAVKEMNRYSTTQLAVADAEVAQLRIGGIFRAGDSQEFVRVVAAAFGLRADQNGDAIVLSRPAAPPPPAAPEDQHP